MRTSSTRSRMLCGARKARQSCCERVEPAMGRARLGSRKEVIEPMRWPLDPNGRHIDTDRSQPRAGHADEQRFDRLAACGEVLQPRRDEVGARRAVELPERAHGRRHAMSPGSTREVFEPRLDGPDLLRGVMRPEARPASWGSVVPVRPRSSRRRTRGRTRWRRGSTVRAHPHRTSRPRRSGEPREPGGDEEGAGRQRRLNPNRRDEPGAGSRTVAGNAARALPATHRERRPRAGRRRASAVVGG